MLYLLTDRGLVASAKGQHEEAIDLFEQGLTLVDEYQMSADHVVTSLMSVG